MASGGVGLVPSPGGKPTPAPRFGGGGKGPKGAPKPMGGGKPGKGGGRGPLSVANNPLYNPGQSLSGQSLLDAANSLADLQTKDPITELARQIANNNRQGAGAQKLTSGYFNQLENYVKQGVGLEGDIGSGLNSTLSGIANGTGARLGQLGQDQTANLMRYSPQGQGSPVNAGLQPLTQEIARQQGLSAQDMGTSRAFGATQGANYQGLAASNLGTYGLAGQERLGNIAQATRLADMPLTSKIAGLRAQHGALVAADAGKLRQQEIANRFTSQGLGLKRSALNATIAQDKARNALTARGQNITQQDALARIAAEQRGQDLSHQDRVAALAARAAQQHAAANLKAGGGALTLHEQNTDYSTIDRLRSIVHSMQQPLSAAQAKKLGMKPNSKLSESQIRSALGSSYDPTFIEAAYELLGWGHILPKTAAALHAMGLRGGRYNVGPAPSQSVANTFAF